LSLVCYYYIILLHCISEQKTSPFDIYDNLVRCHSSFVNSWQKHKEENLKHTQKYLKYTQITTTRLCVLAVPLKTGNNLHGTVQHQTQTHSLHKKFSCPFR